ncbi:MAG: hypothetical protein PCFJNLEI_03312 [Verrucomicrobiae bacterium]|nr:hypothetical protein [Verrucomicrobiae bacterium]
MVLLELLPLACLADTINFGLLRGTLGVQAGLEFTDNLNNSESDRISNVDWILGPTFNGGLTLPIHIAGTGGEQMTIRTGFAYNEKYSLNGNGHTRSFSSPVTAELFVPLTVGLWRLSLSDSFSFKNDELELAVGLNEATTEQYRNLVAVNASRNFGKATISLRGDRTDTISPTDPDQETTVYQFSFTPSLLIRDRYSLFWANTYALTYQADPDLQDSEGWSSSIGVSGLLTPRLSGVISIGFSHSRIKSQVLGPGDGIFGGIFDKEVLRADNVDGITSSIGLSYANELNPNTTYSISMFNSPGVTAVLKSSSVTEVYGATLRINHLLTPTVTLSPAFTWTHAESLGRDSSGEVTDLFAIQLGLRRRFTANLTGNFNYQYVLRSSNQPDSNYDVNRLSIRINYTF